jgi:hypothetical protein
VPSYQKLLDNGGSYISDDLAKWMERHNIAHVRGTPYHLITQGKENEHWHQTLKNRILLENYCLPSGTHPPKMHRISEPRKLRDHWFDNPAGRKQIHDWLPAPPS